MWFVCVAAYRLNGVILIFESPPIEGMRKESCDERAQSADAFFPACSRESNEFRTATPCEEFVEAAGHSPINPCSIWRFNAFHHLGFVAVNEFLQPGPGNGFTG